ncbi:divalent cation tolerance protein CutA [Selenomonas sp. TAMA-11512]|uniref:divalent cation tolerance protein CutA n=1 Tax=Selenomonas sp. TAMA-11512 TaxID=3095337 RepID=UPI00308DD4A3|nr:divalent cation tolerance protein CutA [Selenomonas sp. TAMA-11512]
MEAAQTKYAKLEIFIPETHFPQLRQALQSVDAGHIGNYDSCLAYSRVTGSWRPLAGASPYDGTVGEVSEAEELKVELRVKAESVEETLAAIRAVHPYETPEIFVLPLWR